MLFSGSESVAREPAHFQAAVLAKVSEARPSSQSRQPLCNMVSWDILLWLAGFVVVAGLLGIVMYTVSAVLIKHGFPAGGQLQNGPDCFQPLGVFSALASTKVKWLLRLPSCYVYPFPLSLDAKQSSACYDCPWLFSLA